MAAVKAKDVERAIGSRDPAIKVMLFYGPDAGLVSERARAAASGFVDDATDPFKLVRLDGDAVADATGRLAEEATSYGLFGGRKAILVRPTSRSLAPSLSACLEATLDDVLIVIEAGDLARNAPLRSLCEVSPRALALPCFADEARDVAQLVAETMREAGLTIDPDARDLLVEALGGDRLATRGELAKLVLYAAGRAGVSVQDVEDVVSDVSATRLDAVVDLTFGGNRQALDGALHHLAAAGTGPAALLAAASRHALQLLAGRDALDQGAALDRVKQSWRGLHFRRAPLVERQLGTWTSAGLADAVSRLQTATLDSRRIPGLGQAIAEAALIAINARSRRG